jgi:hypothetical protein
MIAARRQHHEESMTSRRELLKAGLAASALPLAARAHFTRAEQAAVPLYNIVYDTRFAASVAFAERAAARGLGVLEMAGDVTRLWYDDLYHRWRQGPAAIAGLTAHGALFCLERLAWDQRLRVVYRGEHSAAAGGLVHRLDGPAPMLAAAAMFGAWGAALADVVAACPHERAARGTATFMTEGAPPASEPLFSWVIAPVARS